MSKYRYRITVDIPGDVPLLLAEMLHDDIATAVNDWQETEASTAYLHRLAFYEYEVFEGGASCGRGRCCLASGHDGECKL